MSAKQSIFEIGVDSRGRGKGRKFSEKKSSLLDNIISFLFVFINIGIEYYSKSYPLQGTNFIQSISSIFAL
ncbi:hypothetical protein Gasu2_47650 [Galdieria sulphuraria]|nr:hypothetical protein Gasu2_47650 [Galdieria sulphuraria]